MMSKDDGKSHVRIKCRDVCLKINSSANNCKINALKIEDRRNEKEEIKIFTITRPAKKEEKKKEKEKEKEKERKDSNPDKSNEFGDYIVPICMTKSVIVGNQDTSYIEEAKRSKYDPIVHKSTKAVVERLPIKDKYTPMKEKLFVPNDIDTESGVSTSKFMNSKVYNNDFKSMLIHNAEDLETKRVMMFKPIPKTEAFMSFRLVMTKTGITSIRYDLLLDAPDSKQIIMNCVKYSILGTYYVISLETSAYSRKAKEFLGKIRSKKNDEYHLYDSGYKQEKIKKGHQQLRLEYLAVRFPQADISKKSYKSMQVVIQSPYKKPSTAIPGSKTKITNDSLLADFDKKSDQVIAFYNKTAKYDEKTKKYFISFLKDSFSIENGFILMDSYRSTPYMIMKKEKDKEYRIMCQAPFSLFQVFGIAMIFIVSRSMVI